MTHHRVRAGTVYAYDPVPLDRIEPPIGVQMEGVKVGTLLRVVNLPGCPKANTMGHCHVETLEGHFAGLVCTNSLIKVPK